MALSLPFFRLVPSINDLEPVFVLDNLMPSSSGPDHGRGAAPLANSPRLNHNMCALGNHVSNLKPGGPLREITYRMKISATVITLNEERNIRAALESLFWADEIIVVDSNSTDRTVEIAREFTTEVHVRQWPGYSAQKTFAAEVARHDWIFNLDADERVSAELARELVALKENDAPSAAGYEMPRATLYLGRWIKHAGWYP